MRPLVIVILLSIFANNSIISQSRLQRISGELQDAGFANNRSYLSIKNFDTGRLQHVICSREIVNEISNSLKKSSGIKIHIHAKVKILQLGSPLLECVNRPIIRTMQSDGNQLAGVQEDIPKSRPSPNDYSNRSNLHLIQESSVNSKNTNTNFTHKPGDKYVSGQILEADPDSGLLTIQSATRKTYLKIDPLIAKRIHENLISMQIQNIEGRFTFDRNLGFFVGSDNSYRTR